jgi:hypothetical protein
VLGAAPDESSDEDLNHTSSGFLCSLWPALSWASRERVDAMLEVRSIGITTSPFHLTNTSHKHLNHYNSRHNSHHYYTLTAALSPTTFTHLTAIK